MEPQNIHLTQPTAAAESKQKETKGLIIGMVVCAILGFGGIAFGVYEHLSKGNETCNPQTQPSESTVGKNDNSEDKSQTATSIIITTPDGAETELANSTDGDPADYIYVGEWGMKIKLPENLTMVSYEFRQYPNSYRVDSGVGLTGAVTGGQYTPSTMYAPDFVDLDKCSPRGWVLRQPKGVDDGMILSGKLLFSDDDYNYVWSVRQAYCLESEKLWEDESTKTIHDTLTNINNYSAI